MDHKHFVAIIENVGALLKQTPTGSTATFINVRGEVSKIINYMIAELKVNSTPAGTHRAIRNFSEKMGTRISGLRFVYTELYNLLQSTHTHVAKGVILLGDHIDNEVKFYSIIADQLTIISGILKDFKDAKPEHANQTALIHEIGHALNPSQTLTMKSQAALTTDTALQWEAINRLATIVAQLQL